MAKKKVHIVGTGTIGEPLIGLFCDFKEELGIDEVSFHKRSPLTYDRSKVKDLMRRGAKLVVDNDRYSAFQEIGLEPSTTTEEAIYESSVIIDCTPSGVGHENKRKYYSKYDRTLSGIKYKKGFIAQGSEKGFGTPYAYGINDDVLNGEKFIQVVSCNTHNISVLLQAVCGGRYADIHSGQFVCMRRSSDVSNHSGNSSFIPSPSPGKHDDPEFGTHHARDAHDLYKTMGHDLVLYSSAIKLNTQYMHTTWFNVKMMNDISLERVMKRFEENKRVALTEKKMSSEVFSFGRDHGHFGRILNPAVIAKYSIEVLNNNQVVGFAYTPQDGNSLLSSIGATMRYLYPDSYRERMKCLDQFLYSEV
jgi:glyceraldehyde-3-phosphate dehydrogenase (NAD(P))